MPVNANNNRKIAMKRSDPLEDSQAPTIQGYKSFIRCGLRRLDLEKESDRYIEFFQRYWVARNFVIPPWAEADITFYERHQDVLRQLFKEMPSPVIPCAESQVGWVPLQELGQWGQWVRVIEGQLVPVQIYFTCNLRKKGTPSEQAELHFLHTQCPAESLIYPGDLEIPYGEAGVEFCRELIRTSADILIFSEYEVEYGQFLGFGVYQEILEAQQKGIPILLLREEQFWLNPQIAIHDTENLVCHAQVSATPHPPIQFLEDLFYFGDI